MNINRRQSIALLGCAAALPCLYSLTGAAVASGESLPHIATNTYPWRTFAKRSGRTFVRHTDQLLGDIAETAIVGYEPIIESAAELDGLAERLTTHGLEMRSIYVNSVLHDEAKADKSKTSVTWRGTGTVTIIPRGQPAGCVTHLSTDSGPIRFGERSLRREVIVCRSNSHRMRRTSASTR